MRVPKTVVALLAATIALPLAGCFGLPTPGEIANHAGEIASHAGEIAGRADDLADQALELADTLSGIDYGKMSRLVVRDAATDEVVREVTDQAEIERAFEPLSGVNGLADAPDAAAEYVLELWQPETQRAGQDASDVQDVKVLEVTTYEGSSAVTIEVSPIGLSLDLAASEEAVDALRALAG